MKLSTLRATALTATLGSSLLVYSQSVLADLLRWNLQNVGFNDGGVATGFFLLDTQTAGPLTDFRVKVAGGKYPSYEYSPQNSSGSGRANPNFPGFSAVGVDFEATGRSLAFRASQLTKPGSYPLASIKDGGPSPSDDLSYETQGGFDVLHPARWIRTGSVTTGIPQPPGTLIKWTLDGVKFDNGGTATGWFVYDASMGAVEDFSLHIEGLCAIFNCADGKAQDINQSFPCQPSPYSFAPLCWQVHVYPRAALGTLSFSNGLSPSSEIDLNLATGKPLTDGGGTVPLSLGHFDEGSLTGSGAIFSHELLHSSVIAGALVGTVVPEPSRALFLVIGLAALGMLASARRHLGM